jgi:hypothetical protein
MVLGIADLPADDPAPGKVIESDPFLVVDIGSSQEKTANINKIMGVNKVNLRIFYYTAF